MKKLATLFAACLMTVTAVDAQTCCTPNTVAPAITPGFYTTSQIGGNVNTPAPPAFSPAASADLPTIEYIITKRNSPALDDTGVPDTTGGGGDVIIGADMDGIFMPDDMGRYGIRLNAGDTFDLTAVGYDLAVIQELADSLLNGSSPGSGACCGLFFYMSQALGEPALAGFCDSVNNAGIMNSTQINGMNEVLTIFDVFSSGQTSMGSLVNTLNLINSNGTFISTDCGGTGGNNFLSFGIDRSAKYGYDREGTIAVQQLSDVSLFMLFPNPAKDGAVNIYFTTQKEVDLTVNMFDALGQRVHHQTLGNISGDFNTMIPVSDLAAGMYYVELTDGHKNQVLKVVVD